MWYDEFKSIVTNNIGRTNPRAVTEQHFTRIDKLPLWNTFEVETSHLSDIPYTKRIKYLEAGHFTSIPKCYCGEEVKIMQGEVSEYCSQSCMLSSPKRGKQISETKKAQDHTAANIKRQGSMIAKYGVGYNSQRKDIHHIWERSKVSKEIETLLLDYKWMHQEYVVNKRTGVDIADELGCFYGTVLDYCKHHGFKIRKRSNYSMIEVKLDRWLDSLDIKHEMGNYDIISPQEIDCVIPSAKLGIEINGLRWHSQKPKEFHQKKSDDAMKAGYFLFHFTDYEWTHKQDIVKSMILNKLGNNIRIGARKCKVVEISNTEAKQFLVTNHIQGYAPAKVTYALIHENEIVMLGSFSSPRFNKHYDWEIVRVCSKLGTNIVGGLSRILDTFIHSHTGTILTYVDKKYGTGESFLKNGFALSHTTNPGYVWTDGTNIISRFKTQKSQLQKWLPSFDSNRSETENMESAGYSRLWDSGQLVLIR